MRGSRCVHVRVRVSSARPAPFPSRCSFALRMDRGAGGEFEAPAAVGNVSVPSTARLLLSQGPVPDKEAFPATPRDDPPQGDRSSGRGLRAIRACPSLPPATRNRGTGFWEGVGISIPPGPKDLSRCFRAGRWISQPGWEPASRMSLSRWSCSEGRRARDLARSKWMTASANRPSSFKNEPETAWKR